LANLPRTFAGGELAQLIHQLLEPVFPGLLAVKSIEDTISKQATHKRQYIAAFAKRRNPNPAKNST
jgi:hypothetical protein